MNTHKGLSSTEVNQKLAEFGYNELPDSKTKNLVQIALETVKEPMFLLLLACGGLYILLGDLREGLVLLSTILIIIAITFFQYRKTEKALSALKKLSAPRVVVLRDGKETRIPGREVVPGDLVLVNEGDRIPADAILIECLNLSIDESVLTGESQSVEKNTDTQATLYSGTLAVRGTGLARVTHTGLQSQLGKIASSLHHTETEVTRLQSEMKVFIRRLAFIGIGLSVVVAILFYITRKQLLQSLLTGLSVSMAMLPEEFPVVLTVFLALGAWRLSKKNVLTRRPAAIESLGAATVLCSDKTGTITQNKMEVVYLYNGSKLIPKSEFEKSAQELSSLIQNAIQATNNNSIDPMEKAILKLSPEQNDSTKAELVKEYPLSKKLLAMTRVLRIDKQTPLLVSCKGAPEVIFQLCRMSDSEKQIQVSMVNQLAEKGYRVLGVACAETETVLPEHQTDFPFRFVGLLAFEDPIRTEVPKAIQECFYAGIRVIMITGDFPATARTIGAQAGFTQTTVLSGTELQKLSDTELREAIKSVDIFARVNPEQKLRIVDALKRNGDIVAMTGDGVNDAPALKKAHIGIAMGNKGTDVAREASSLVLLDDNFASIVAAIKLGRRIFDNLQKAMSYILAIHVPIIGLALIPAMIPSIPFFLLPLHIVFMELIIDPVCSIAFESESEERDVMSRPPRDPNERFFGFRPMLYSLFQGLLLLAMVIVVYLLSKTEGHSDGETRAITFSTLIIGNIFLILTNLSKTRNALSVIFKGNKSALIILTGALLLLFAVISIPALQSLFNFEFPGYAHFFPALLGAGSILCILELLKIWRNKTKQRDKTLEKNTSLLR